MPRQEISDSLTLIFSGIRKLKAAFPNRHFTIDGRLVGDIGEVIAALEYDMDIHDVSQPTHDGTTKDGKHVQIKATFKDSLTFSSVPDYYLGFKLFEDGTYEEIYNGPGSLIFDRFSQRRGIGRTLLSFPNRRLKELSETVPEDQRVPRRIR